MTLFNTKIREKKKRLEKNEHCLNDLQENVNYTNLSVLRILEKREREKKKAFEDMMIDQFSVLMNALIHTHRTLSKPQWKGVPILWSHFYEIFIKSKFVDTESRPVVTWVGVGAEMD